MTEINYNLPVWDLSEIYTDIKDPKIKTNLKKIKNSSDDFLRKWKGKIKDLNPSDFLSCIETYQEICENIHRIGTHSSLIFVMHLQEHHRLPPILIHLDRKSDFRLQTPASLRCPLGKMPQNVARILE